MTIEFANEVSNLGDDQLLHGYSERYARFCKELERMTPDAEELRPEVMAMRDEIRRRMSWRLTKVTAMESADSVAASDVSNPANNKTPAPELPKKGKK